MLSPVHGDIAQLVEHLLCKQRVRGSIPRVSTHPKVAHGSREPATCGMAHPFRSDVATSVRS